MENQLKMQHFFVTIKRVGKRLPRISDYESYFKRLNHKPEFIDIIRVLHDVYEMDKNKRMHYHGLYVVDHRFSMTENEMFDLLNIFKTNWHINVRECYNNQDVESCFTYMQKEAVNEFLESLHQGQYLFRDQPKPKSLDLDIM